MLPIINLGPLTIPVPYFVLLLGIWLGAILTEDLAKKSGQDAEYLDKIIWGSIFAGLLGARVSFIARNTGAFENQWGSIFSLNLGLLDPAGGILIGLATGYFLAVRFKQSDWSLIDRLVPFAAVLTSTIFLANFASGSGYGSFTELPWGIDLWGGPRHPVQLYYLLSSLVVLYWVVKPSMGRDHLAGTKLLLFIIYTTGYLTLLSAFQDPGNNIIGGFRGLQLISWILFTFGLFIYNKLTITKDTNALS